MPSTSVHLPADLIRHLGRVAKRRGISRNRLIAEACRSLVQAGQRPWPTGFFASERLSAADLKVLESTLDEWTDGVVAARRSKKAPPF